MIQADKVRFILLEEFVKSQTKNPHYSMRAYAARVGIGQSAISEILAGKRPITQKTAEKILHNLNINPQQIAEIVKRDENDAVDSFQQLDMDTFCLIADWYYYAILSLAETEDFDGSVRFICKRLSLSEKIATDAVERLIRLGMLKKNTKTGLILSTGQQFAALSKFANAALKKANRQNLELATEALDKIEHEHRDFTAITLCFDTRRMDDARKMIQNFRRQFCRVMETGHKKDVFKLCIQLFPLTNLGENNEN